MKNPAFEYMSYTETVNTVFYIMAVIAFFVFPFFTMCQLLLDIEALFSKDLVWKKIPHTGKQYKS